MTDIELRIRRAVMHASQGKSAKFLLEGADVRHLHTYTEAYARSKLLKVSLTEDGPHLVIQVIGKLASKAKYGEVDSLDVGQSHIFTAGVAEHQLIRSSMAYRTNKSGRRFSCTVEGGGLVVTRIPANDAERAQHPHLADVGRRANKYGFERLGTEDSIVIKAPKAEHERVRVAAYRAGVLSGIPLTCRTQADGSLIVSRVQALDAVGGEPSRVAVRASKHGLERLETVREITFHPAGHAALKALRVAVSTKSLLTGWRLTCRNQPDGSVLVTRLDVPMADAAE